MTDTCPIHNTPVRREYEFGRLRPQPTVTVYQGCKCATFAADMPGGFETAHLPSYAEAEGRARFALAIWRAV